MIEIVEIPKTCSLTKNSMVFKVKSNQFFIAPDVFPTLTWNFNIALGTNCWFQWQFINPENFNFETIRIRTVENPLEEGDILAYGVEATAIAQNLNWYTDTIIAQLKNYSLLNAYYEVIKIAAGEIQFKAKTASEDFLFKHIDESFNDYIFTTLVFDYDVVESAIPALEREGYQLKAQIYYKNPRVSSTNFELINTSSVFLDENSNGFIDVAEIINGKIESDFDELPIPPYNDSLAPNWQFIPPNLYEYFVVFSETWSDEPSENITKSNNLYAHWGGISTDDEYRNDPINHLLTQNSFLSAFSSKQTYKGFNDFAYFMNSNSDASIYVHLTVITNQRTINTRIINNYGVTLKPFETFGFYSNIDFYLDNPSFLFNPITLATGEEVKKYTFRISTRNLETGVWDNTVFIAQYTYYYSNRCALKGILFFNSFGLPEMFYTSSIWDESINIISELASKSNEYNNSALRQKNFIFSSNSMTSISAESMFIKRDEANRLQQLLNSTHTFIAEKNAYIPIVMQTKQAVAWQNSVYLSTIPFNFIKANSTDRVSFFKKLPVIVHSRVGYSDVFSIKLNSYKLATAGNLKIFKNLANPSSSATSLVKNLVINTSTLSYTTNVAVTNWHTDGLPEGSYLYEVSLTDIEGNTDVLRGVVFIRYKRITFLTNQVGAPKYIGMNARTATNSWVQVNLSLGGGDHFNKNLAANEQINFLLGYSVEGWKKVSVKAPSFDDISSFKNVADVDDVSSTACLIKDLQIDDLSTITTLHLFNVKQEYLAINTFTKLRVIRIRYSEIKKLDVGFLPDLTSIHVTELDFTADGLEHFIRQFFDYRKAYTEVITIELQTLVTANQETLDMINGTGLYSGDGLVQNDFIVNIS